MLLLLIINGVEIAWLFAKLDLVGAVKALAYLILISLTVVNHGGND